MPRPARRAADAARRLAAFCLAVGALVLTVGCGDSDPQKTHADVGKALDAFGLLADSKPAQSALSKPALSTAVVAPAPAYRIGDTLRTAVALATPPAGQVQALKSAGTGKYVVARLGTASYVAREYRNGALVRADTVRYAIAAPPPPAPAVVVSVSAQVDTMHFATQQLTARVTRGGAADTLARVAWAFSPASVCIPQDAALPGRVRALADGSCTATARDSVSGVAGSRAVVVRLTAPVDTVTPPPAPVPADTTPTTPTTPPPPSGARFVGAAELPRATYAPSMAETPTARTVRVPVGADDGASACAAIRAARPGDRIALAPGTVVRGACVVTGAGRGSAGFVVVTTDTVLPPEGTRMTDSASRALRLARFVNTSTTSALSLAPGAGNLRLVGVRIDTDPALAFAYVLAALGDHQWTDPAAYPDRVILDRVVVDGGGTDVASCVRLNGTRLAVLSSSLVNCHARGRDAQAVACIGGAGPYALVNNDLEGSGENVMCGGSDSRAPSLVPADITVTGNHIRKPRAWQGVWTAKTLLELKVGRRVLIEGNLIEGDWTDGQQGTAVTFKSVNQECAAPWSETSDVVFRGNLVRDTEHGLNLAAAPEASRCAAVPMARVAVVGNVVETTGGAGRFLEMEAVADARVDHNTAVLATGGLRFNAGVAARLTFTANRVTANPYGDVVSSADGHGRGDAALAYHAPGARFAGNAIVGAYGAGGLPSTNGAPAPDAGADTAAVRAAADRAVRGRP